MSDVATQPLGTVRSLLASVPRIIPILLVPSWAAWLTLERDAGDLDHILYFYVPEMFDRPLRLLLNLTVTPIVNTEDDQIILVSVLVIVFGGLLERRLGLLAAFLVFWSSSATAAIVGGALFHLIEPWLGHYEVVASVRERVFNGGSAGGYGLMGAYAATTRYVWWWAVAFVLWEPTFWVVIAQALEFTPTFHVLAFLTGLAMVRTVFLDRLRRYRDGRAPERVEQTPGEPRRGAPP